VISTDGKVLSCHSVSVWGTPRHPLALLEFGTGVFCLHIRVRTIEFYYKTLFEGFFLIIILIKFTWVRFERETLMEGGGFEL